MLLLLLRPNPTPVQDCQQHFIIISQSSSSPDPSYSQHSYLALVRYLDRGVLPQQVIVRQLVDFNRIAHAHNIVQPRPIRHQRGAIFGVAHIPAPCEKVRRRRQYGVLEEVGCAGFRSGLPARQRFPPTRDTNLDVSSMSPSAVVSWYGLPLNTERRMHGTSTVMFVIEQGTALPSCVLSSSSAHRTIVT